MQIHQAVCAFSVADEREKPVGEVGEEETADNRSAKSDPEILANSRVDETAPCKVFPEHQGCKRLANRGATKPEDGFTHLDGVVKLNSEPLGRRARNERKGQDCSKERTEIPAALPVRPIGEYVTGRGDFAVLHGMPPCNGVYISLLQLSQVVGTFRTFDSW